MPDPSLTPQARADQVRAFQAELAALDAEGVATLAADQRAAVEAHHRELLTRLAREQGADTSESLQQLSIGLRLATLIGGLALTAAVVFFVFQFWGTLPTAGQLALGVAAPLVPLLLAEFAVRRERTVYLGHLFAVVASAGFLLNLVLLQRTLNLPDSPHFVLAFGFFALVLAYRFGNRIILAAGLLAAMYWVASSLYSLTGGWYLDFPMLPETILVPGLLVLLLPSILPHERQPGFSEAYRVVGLLVVGLVVAVLSVDGSLTLLPFGQRGGEIAYTLAGFTLAIGALVVGVRREWRHTTTAGTALTILMIMVKAVDWWWTLMPAWLFFLVLGALALASIAGLKRLRDLAVGSA